jgi:hypothetical protein
VEGDAGRQSWPVVSGFRFRWALTVNLHSHQLNATPPILKIPQSQLQITVHSFLRPGAVDIAFEILDCINSHFQKKEIKSGGSIVRTAKKKLGFLQPRLINYVVGKVRSRVIKAPEEIKIKIWFVCLIVLIEGPIRGRFAGGLVRSRITEAVNG